MSGTGGPGTSVRQRWNWLPSKQSDGKDGAKGVCGCEHVVIVCVRVCGVMVCMWVWAHGDDDI